MTPLTIEMGSYSAQFNDDPNTLPDSSGMVAGLVRNGWPDSLGMSGRIRPEYMAELLRNTQKSNGT